MDLGAVKEGLIITRSAFRQLLKEELHNGTGIKPVNPEDKINTEVLPSVIKNLMPPSSRDEGELLGWNIETLLEQIQNMLTIAENGASKIITAKNPEEAVRNFRKKVKEAAMSPSQVLDFSSQPAPFTSTLTREEKYSTLGTFEFQVADLLNAVHSYSKHYFCYSSNDELELRKKGQYQERLDLASKLVKAMGARGKKICGSGLVDALGFIFKAILDPKNNLLNQDERKFLNLMQGEYITNLHAAANEIGKALSREEDLTFFICEYEM